MPYAPDSTLSPRRLTAIAAVVVFHVAIIWAVKNGLARDVIELIKGPLDVKIIQEVVEPEKEPPPPPVKIETPPPFVPLPELDIQLPPDPPPTTITASSIIAPPPAPVSSSKGQIVSRSGVGMPRDGLSKPPYPPIALRLSQEGAVQLLLYILEDGSVGDAKVKQSSGFPQLDQAAVAHAKRAWRFTPAKENGKPIAVWYPVIFKFELNNR